MVSILFYATGSIEPTLATIAIKTTRIWNGSAPNTPHIGLSLTFFLDNP